MNERPTIPPRGHWAVEPIDPGDVDKIEHSQEIVLHWQHGDDAPRVTPPIAVVQLGKTVVFRIAGNATAEIHLPPDLVDPSVTLPVVVDRPDRPVAVPLTGDKAALLPRGYMYAYKAFMTHQGAHPGGAPRTMAAVGCSPPGMVLDDPDSRTRRP